MPETVKLTVVAQAAPCNPYEGIHKKLRIKAIINVMMPVMVLILAKPSAVRIPVSGTRSKIAEHAPIIRIRKMGYGAYSLPKKLNIHSPKKYAMSIPPMLNIKNRPK